MLYPFNNVNKIINRIVWVTQRNIEVEENRDLKKEELKEKLKINKYQLVLLYLQLLAFNPTTT
jgi:hypothetical protein